MGTGDSLIRDVIALSAAHLVNLTDSTQPLPAPSQATTTFGRWSWVDRVVTPIEKIRSRSIFDGRYELTLTYTRLA